MTRTLTLLTLLLLPGVAQAQAVGDHYELRSRVLLAIGTPQELAAGKGKRESQELSFLLEVERVLPDGRVSGTITQGEQRTRYTGQLSNAIWQVIPRLLQPLELELSSGSRGARKTQLEVAGRQIEVSLEATPSKGRRGELKIAGQGSHLIKEQGVTLAVDLKGRLLTKEGADRLDLRVKWSASGGPGQPAESRLGLRVSIRKLAAGEGVSK
tara:strand:+ start:1230 stop:1865 length:636 start_codon:yes stop_codon:yes gene_type:complete